MKRLISFVAMTATLSAFAYSAARAEEPINSNSEVGATIKQVEALAEKGENQQALELLNKVIVPTKPDAWLLVARGNTYKNLGQGSKALEDLTAATAIVPHYACAWRLKAEIFEQYAEYASTIVCANLAILADPNDFDSYAIRGRCFTATESYEKAISDLSVAISNGVVDSSVRKARAKAYSNKGFDSKDYEIHKDWDWNHKAAIIDYTEAIKEEPDDATLYANRAVEYSDLRKYAEAIADDTKAIAIDPKYQWAFYSRGLNYSALKNHTQAIADFTAALKLDPADTRAKLYRASEYERIGENAKALSDCDSIIAQKLKDNWTAWAWIHKSDACAKSGNKAKALEYLNYAVAIDPQRLHNRSAFYRKNGNDSKGLADFKKAMVLNVPLEKQADELKIASVVYFGQAISDAPKAARPYIMRAREWQKLGITSKSLEDCCLGIALEPKNAEAYMLRGMIYKKLKQTDKSLKDFEIAVKLNPTLAPKIALASDMF